MAGLNKCAFIGHLGADPEARSMNNGGEVVSFRLAVTENWKDRDGQRQERTEWVSVVIFNEGLGKVAKSYLRKGSKVYLEGKWQTRKWTDKDGADRYSTECVLQKFNGELVLLDAREGGGSAGSAGQEAQRSRPQPAAFDPDLDDDVPFASADPRMEGRIG